MPKSNHQHPGQDEPRAYGQTHHERFEIDLNSASEEELAELPMVGPERARRLIEHRPFNSWEDVERVPGFDEGMIDDLRSGGAQIGGKRH
jgi:DNA uptake protein ComE-like DNA-binding protein